MRSSVFCLILLNLIPSIGLGAEVIDIWPDVAPGETEHSVGEKMPYRDHEVPPVTRVIKISRPTMTFHSAKNPNGSAVVILPGGGFAKVVPDKEGTEAADWLNQHGISAFVLSYRTTEGRNKPGWVEPLQDAQRAIAFVRANAANWDISRASGQQGLVRASGQQGLKEDRIGLLGFSAGGQVAARLLCDGGKKSYDMVDAVDDVSHRPDFAILVYPWNLYDVENDAMVDGLTVPENCPPTYIVHTHDDRSSSLGAVHFYVGLKKHGIASELHVYGNGGHGYGLRPVEGSQIDSWTNHAAHWLITQQRLSD